MMKLFSVLVLLLFFSASVFTQAPQKMSYQAVIRNENGVLVQNSNVGIRISLLQGTSEGELVFSETHTILTNTNGLISLAIGSGDLADGNFETIDWANGPYFIMNEIDPSGGTNYTITGTSELMSVPYALFSGNGTPGPQGPSGFLNPGSAAGNTPYWNGSSWVTNSSNFFNNGSNIGIGTATPSTILDIAGGNNWDLVNGNGDFKIGNSLYRLKMGVATDGGGAGDAGIMQHGQPGGYNVLSLGAQGNKLLFINGESKRVGIGTDAPASTVDIRGTIRIVDGTQGAGKVLTSDASGAASWLTAGSSSAHTIGESYGGGVVFYVYDNGQHGLIAATADHSAPIPWYNGTYRFTGTGGDGVGAGAMNTTMIVATQISDNQTGNFAAKVCADYSVTAGSVNYGDWYLPSKYELNLLYLQKSVIGVYSFNGHWSSTEGSQNSNAWIQIFYEGPQYEFQKSASLDVRCVREF